MKFSQPRFSIFFLATAIFLAACSPATAPAAVTPPAAQPVQVLATSTVAASTLPTGAVSTPNPCAPENIGASVNTVNRLMRAFDDGSSLASSTPRDQLRPAIAELQKIRRDAEDNPVPQCLVKLKQLQINHMNAVINTLLGFMSGADSTVTNEGIAAARQLHDQYSLELARVMGMTVVMLPSPTSGTPAVTASGTEATMAPSGTPTEGGPRITVTGPSTVNMRKKPSLEAESTGLLLVNDTAVVVARSSDDKWYLIKIPGRADETAWVFASLVTLSAPIDTLPVATALP